jgi:hypothetical protein
LNQDVMNCPACGRVSPTARAVCMYCGTLLPVTRIETAPHQRQIDNSELAFNTVIDTSRTRVDEQTENAFASALQMEPSEARGFLVTGKRVPVSRSLTRVEAELIAALMRTCGIGATVIADEDMKLDTDLTRARRITRNPGHLQIHHSTGEITVALSEIRLMVVGSLRGSRVDYTEGLSRSNGASGSLVDTSEFRSDEMLVDVYANNLDQSFRMKADGFDYSGLVRPLSFRAEVNFRSAIAAIQGSAPHAIIDDEFPRLRGLLSRAWPQRSRLESRGFKRAGIGFRSVAQASVISDNREQFDRYSRLMFLTM